MKALTEKIFFELSIADVEAYRVLRTNIQFCNAGKKVKSIAITSCMQGEGKTTTSINLAISMAKSGMMVLLIDADMHKSMQTKRIATGIKMGLSNYLSGFAELDDIINQTNIENLHYVGCGPRPPNPAELIGTETMTGLLDRVHENYDMVIIDTPPLGSVIDCALISPHVDGTIIVFASKMVDIHNAARVLEQLKNVNARILGVIMNKIRKSEYRYYYNSYNYYTGNQRGSFIKKLFRRKKKWEKT